MEIREIKEIERSEAKAKEQIKAKGGEYETGFYAGRVLSFVLGLVQSLTPLALFLFLLWALPFFGLSGLQTMLIACCAVIALLVFTDWGDRWVDRHKKLFKIGNKGNKS